MARQQAGRVALRPAVAVLLLLAATSPPGVPAQEVLRERTSDSVEVAPGVRVERSVEARRNSTLAVELLSFNPATFGGSLQAIRNPDGSPVLLGRALVSGDAIGVYGLPSDAATVVLADGRLANWPVEGAALMVESEGSVVLEHVSPLAAPSIEVAPGVVLPLAIGTVYPVVAGGARILPGPIAGADTARLASPGDEAWVLVGEKPRAPWIEPAAQGGAGRSVVLPAEPLGSPPRDVREFEALLVFPRAGASPGGGASGRTFTGRLELPEEVAAARIVVRTGEWLLRDTAPVGLPPGETAPRRAIGIDASKGAISFVAVPQDIRQPGATRAELVTALREAGITDAVELPPGPPLLLVPGQAQGLGREREGTGAELVLALSRRVHRTGPGYGYERIRTTDRVMSGLEEIRSHPYAALSDARLDGGSRLDGVWAAKFSREPGAANEAILLLARRAQVGAIDLVHASRAGFSPSLNLRRARIYLSEGAGKPWMLVGEVDNQRPIPRQRIDISPPVPAAQVKIEILDPAFLPGADTVRLAEFVVWGRN